MDASNGCLRYVRGSHLAGLRRHATGVVSFSQVAYRCTYCSLLLPAAACCCLLLPAAACLLPMLLPAAACLLPMLLPAAACCSLLLPACSLCCCLLLPAAACCCLLQLLASTASVALIPSRPLCHQAIPELTAADAANEVPAVALRGDVIVHHCLVMHSADVRPCSAPVARHVPPCLSFDFSLPVI